MTELNSKEIHCPSYPEIIVQTLEVHFPNFHNFPRSEQLHNSTSHSASEPNMRLILGPFCSSIALHDPSHYSHVMCELTPVFLCNSQVLLHFNPQILILVSSFFAHCIGVQFPQVAEWDVLLQTASSYGSPFMTFFFPHCTQLIHSPQVSVSLPISMGLRSKYSAFLKS